MTDRKLMLITDHSVPLEGEDKLPLKVRAHREKRTGDCELYSIELSIGRVDAQS